MNNRIRTWFRLPVAVVAMVAMVLCRSNASADDVFFNGSVSESWHDEDNWDDGVEPSFGDDSYFIQNDLTAVYSVGTSSIRKLVVSDTSPGIFQMTGGDLTVAGGSDSFQIGRGCCEADGLVELSGTAILRTESNSGVGERDKGVLHIGPDASVISPDAYWRIGNFGPSVDAGLEGNGLLDVEGTFESRSLFIGVQDGTGVVRVRGNGSVVLSEFTEDADPNYDINMNFNHDPIAHPNQSGTIHMVGSEASMSARTLQSQHDADSPIPNLLWFTADSGGVSPITLTEGVNIDNNLLRVDLDELVSESLTTLLLIDAAPGQIAGTFAGLEVTGADGLEFDVIYDQEVGDVLLQNVTVDPYAVLDDGTLPGGTPELDAARVAYIRDVLGTWIGDSNRDGEFNSSDFVTVFTAGEYEDGIQANSSWSTGDWNGDKEFDSSDFVAAFIDGGFEKGPRQAANAVPEPSAMLLVSLGLLGLSASRRQA